ncbi:PREDICTED: urocortin [Nanorana parkeri]|uniref:urocortin n=1 Tax=Nanorana parkeri TaxID=125878 RepID=UPI0008546710|nr:PREDICTED: urocortin [Nanorana parkeri]
MKAAPFLLLACYLILTAQVNARPMDRSLFEGPRFSLDGLTNNEGAQALLYFLKERFGRGLTGGDPRVQLRLSKGSLSSDRPISVQELAPILDILQTLYQENRPEESDRTFLEVFSDRLKREDPPISIDLTFHILRQMIEIAKNQNQKQQAEQNRIIFDSVGK